MAAAARRGGGPDHSSGDGAGSGSGGERGIPDGLLVGVLAFLLGMTLMVWSATGLAARFAQGAWPDTVTFSRTPAAMRALVTEPHDIAGAWPDTAPSALSGYGLFWGLFIGQLMVLVVLVVFVLGTFARWRAVRAQQRELRRGRAMTPADGGQGVQAQAAAPAPAPAPVEAAPMDAAPVETAPVEAAPPASAAAASATAVPAPRTSLTGIGPGGSGPGPVVLGSRDVRRPVAVQAVRDAEGAALVVTSDPEVWAETKDARAKLGPVLVFDPAQLCDTPARMRWSPSAGCEDRDVAAARATALLAPVRPASRLDAAVADTADTLLRCFLHAAAVDGRPFKQVHRWAQGSQVHDAVRVLRTHPKAAPGAAGELEAALVGHPERRDIAQELTARTLSAHASVHIRNACTPNRTDAVAGESFISEGGTLYVVGESIEDPKSSPGAMPLLTALAASVVEHGRRMAARSSDGRLDPPMTLVLEDVAAVAPLPQLPELLTTGLDQGLPTLALLRSREQSRSRWPLFELPLPAHEPH